LPDILVIVDNVTSKALGDQVRAVAKSRLLGRSIGMVSATDCCSHDLIATNRIVGRVIASQIASASAASVLPRLT